VNRLKSDSAGRSEDQNVNRTETRKTELVRLQMQMKTPLGTGVEAMCVPLWQRTHPYLVHALRLHGKLSLKEVEFKGDKTISLVEKFEGSSVFSLQFGYWWLFLVRYKGRIRSKKQIANIFKNFQFYPKQNTLKLATRKM
jgi:hypothetical protein